MVMVRLHAPVEQPPPSTPAKVWPAVSAQWSWIRRPVRTSRGWTGGLVMLAGSHYLLGVEYDEAATLVDFVKLMAGLHHRVTVRRLKVECDCADAVYRQRCCKHASACVEILGELDLDRWAANDTAAPF